MIHRWFSPRKSTRRRAPANPRLAEVQILEARQLMAATADAFESDNSAQSAKNLPTNGVAQNRSLHLANDVDWATFTLTQESRVVLETNGVAGDTRLWLYASGNLNTSIGYDDDGGAGSFSLLTVWLDPGTYYVKIDEYGQDSPIDAYTLKATATLLTPDAYERDNTPQTAGQITPGAAPQARSLHRPTDTDWVWFRVTEASRVTLQTSGTSGDTFVSLYSSNDFNRVIASNDNAPNTQFATLVAYLDPGTYYARIEEAGQNNTVNSYSLATSAVPLRTLWDGFEQDDTPQTAKSITAGATAQIHNLHRPTDADWVKFTLSGPGEVVLQTDGTNGDTFLALYAATDTTRPLATDDDSGQGSFSRIVTPLSAGTYFARVTEYGQDATLDRYTLALQVLPPADLAVTSFTTPAMAPFLPGETLRLDWTVGNRGPGIADPGQTGRPSWTDRVWFSSDDQISSDDYSLGSWSYSGGPLGVNQQYAATTRITLPGNSGWAGRSGYLILRSDAEGEVADVSRTNNQRALAVRFATVQLQSPAPGRLVDTVAPLTVTAQAIDRAGPYTVDIAIDDDQDPTNGVLRWLSTSQPVSATQSTTVATSALTGITPRSTPYYLQTRARRTDTGTVSFQRPSPLIVTNRAAQSDDMRGEAVGGNGFEVFGIDAARLDRSLLVTVRTNFDADRSGSDTGGDLRLIVGGTTYGLVLNTHRIDNGTQVNAGTLYRGASFRGGTTVSSVPTFVKSYASAITGKTAIQVVDTADRPWEHEIQARIDLSAFPEYVPGDKVTATWAMYCGNDTDDVEIQPEDPDVALPSAKVNAAGQVEFGYRVNGRAEAFPVNLYLSADKSFDPAQDTLLRSTTVAAGVNTSGVGTLPLDMTPDISRFPYILVVTDPWSSSSPRGQLTESDDQGNNVQVISVSNLSLIDATTQDFRNFTVKYRVFGADAPEFGFTVFVSEDEEFDPSKDVAVGAANSGRVVDSTLRRGQSGSTPTPYSFAFDLGVATPPTLTRRFAIVVADRPTTANPRGEVVETEESTDNSLFVIPLMPMGQKGGYRLLDNQFQLGVAESSAVNSIQARVIRNTPEFGQLQSIRSLWESIGGGIKNEELTTSPAPHTLFDGDDGLVHPDLVGPTQRFTALISSAKSSRRLVTTTLRINEAFDEEGEHAEQSYHYEGRAIDLVGDNLEAKSRLAGLGILAGFHWVWHEKDSIESHVHLSGRGSISRTALSLTDNLIAAVSFGYNQSASRKFITNQTLYENLSTRLGEIRTSLTNTQLSVSQRKQAALASLTLVETLIANGVSAGQIRNAYAVGEKSGTPGTLTDFATRLRGKINAL